MVKERVLMLVVPRALIAHWSAHVSAAGFQVTTDAEEHDLRLFDGTVERYLTGSVSRNGLCVHVRFSPGAHPRSTSPVAGKPVLLIYYSPDSCAEYQLAIDVSIVLAAEGAEIV